MFRHSDGNKNSWEEREKANKAFLSVHHHGRHHRHQPCLHFIKISANFWSFPPSIWQNGGSQNSGIPAPSSLDSHLLLIPEPDLSPAAHFFLSRRHFLNLFWPDLLLCEKFLFFQTVISYGSTSKNVAQCCGWGYVIIPTMVWLFHQSNKRWMIYVFFSQVFLQLFLARYLIQWISYRNTCPYESTFLHGAFLYEQRHRQRRRKNYVKSN